MTSSRKEPSSEKASRSQSIDGSGSEPGDERRMSHNEIERRRRDNQRERLDDLRKVLPNMRDSKSSMVATIVRAKEYILQLQTRVADLERLLAMAHVSGGPSPAVGPFHHPQHHQFHGPSPPQPSLSAGLPSLALSPGILPMPSQGQHILPPIAPKPSPALGLSVSRSASLDEAIEEEGADDQQPKAKRPAVPFKRGRQGSTVLYSGSGEDPAVAREIIEKIPLEPLIAAEEPKPAPEAPTKKRRDSALVLPTADPNLYLYGHRDSMQNLFAAPLPFIMQQQQQAESDLRCATCARGINNLIMIDCDRCHTWFHIRCIGLDPECIPVHWTCSNCPKA